MKQMLRKYFATTRAQCVYKRELRGDKLERQAEIHSRYIQ